MEFFPGAFEQEWERRRAMLMHETQLGQTAKSDWDEPRRGGVARIGDEGLGVFHGAHHAFAYVASFGWGNGCGGGGRRRVGFSRCGFGHDASAIWFGLGACPGGTAMGAGG